MRKPTINELKEIRKWIELGTWIIFMIIFIIILLMIYDKVVIEKIRYVSIEW